MTDDQILALIKSQSKQIRQAVEQSTLTTFTHAYRNLTMDELTAYADFASTRECKRYYSQLTAALDAVLSAESKEFGRRLLMALGQRKA